MYGDDNIPWDFKTRKENMKEEFMNVLERMFNGKAANRKLMDALNWEREFYINIRSELIKDGAVKSGRGRGGTVIATGK